MAKRSQKRPSRHERNQAGCVSSLISMFDFRHGRSTRRLLADRKLPMKQTAGAANSGNGTVLVGRIQDCENAEDPEENEMPVIDIAKPSVKELMEEEMFNEIGTINLSHDSEMSVKQITSNGGKHLKWNQKKKNKRELMFTDMKVTESDDAEWLTEKVSSIPGPKTSEEFDAEKIVERLAGNDTEIEYFLKNDFLGVLDILSAQAASVVDQKVLAAVKLLIEKKLSNIRNCEEESQYSEELVDAIKIVTSNKGLFLKLLQDPNSGMVKHIPEFETTSSDKDQNPSCLPTNFSDKKVDNTKSSEYSNHKHRNFFRRRSKSSENLPLEGDKDLQSSNQIVILKPGSARAHSSEADATVGSISLQLHYMYNKVQDQRNASRGFSFTEIKRKLWHAIGKERLMVSSDKLILQLSPKHQNRINSERRSLKENFGWSSPNRNHFYTERFALSSPSMKKGEPLANLKDTGTPAGSDTSQSQRLEGSSIYIEAKKHLSEMLNKGHTNAESTTKQFSKSLGRILSLPDYTSSPSCSPRKCNNDIFMTSEKELSPHGIIQFSTSEHLQENQDDCPSLCNQDLENQQGDKAQCLSLCNQDLKSQQGDKAQCPYTHFSIPFGNDTILSLEIPSFYPASTIPEGIEECSKSKPREEGKIIIDLYKLSNDSISGDVEHGDTGEVDNEDIGSQFIESSSCLISDSVEEDHRFSSPAVSSLQCTASRKAEDSDCTIDKLERPSPVSVLEPLSMDDGISPACTLSESVRKEVQPRHIDFEEKSSASEQRICTRISPEDEESAFEYVEAVLLGSGLDWNEFRLRWLSLNEILESSLFDEVELFSSRPRHDQMLLFDCANEALKDMCEFYFGCITGSTYAKVNIQSLPKAMDLITEIWKQVEWHLFQQLEVNSLDQLAKLDLARTGKWMDLQLHIELIGFEVEDMIFSELLEDAIYTAKYERPMLQAETVATADTTS